MIASRGFSGLLTVLLLQSRGFSIAMPEDDKELVSIAKHKD